MTTEFTGERVVPGRVDIDLWNEHVARYAFAAPHCRGKRVLDAGCGTGYGSHEVSAEALNVTAIDVAQEALDFASRTYGDSARWVQSSCTQIPFADGAFDTILAFEVIEHLQDWQKLIQESRRLMPPTGVFIVSTPNKAVYAESRQQSGPNPYHEHEFELEEFLTALRSEFSNVELLAQNHGQCVSFASSTPTSAEAWIAGATDPAAASFFIALCSNSAVKAGSFVYVPEAANILRERERHIRRLEDELGTKDQWLQHSQREHASLVELHTKQVEELRASNEWAEELNRKLGISGERISQLQRELADQQQAAVQLANAYQAELDNLQDDLVSRTKWAQQTESRLTQQLQETATELARQVAELGRCVELLDKAEATVVERTNWAAGLQQDLELAQMRIAMARSSRWIKLGRMLNVGPELDR